MSNVINYLIGVLNEIPTNIILVALITYLVWFNKYYSKRHELIKKRLKKTEECVEKNAESDNEMMLLILKGLITNDNLPDFVRLDFYKSYKEHKGNSWVDAYVNENINERPTKYTRRSTDIAKYKYEKERNEPVD